MVPIHPVLISRSRTVTYTKHNSKDQGQKEVVMILTHEMGSSLVVTK